MPSVRRLLTTCICLLVAALPALADSVGDPVADGIALYEEHCASCHKTFERTTKPQRSAGRLRSSITRFPSMASLASLSDEEIDAIAAALATASFDD